MQDKPKLKTVKVINHIEEMFESHPLVPNGMNMLYDLHMRFVNYEKQIELLLHHEMALTPIEVQEYTNKVFKIRREYIKDKGNFNYDFAFLVDDPNHLKRHIWHGEFRIEPFEKIIVIQEQKMFEYQSLGTPFGDIEQWVKLIESKVYNDYRASKDGEWI